MARVRGAVVVHTPGGPVWLSAGDEVPAGLTVREDLLAVGPPSEPKPAKEPKLASKPAKEPKLASKPAKEPKLASKPAKEPIPATSVPQVSYPTEKWVEYAESLGLTNLGSKRIDVIKAVAGHFNIDTKSRRPADIVADIVAVS